VSKRKVIEDERDEESAKDDGKDYQYEMRCEGSCCNGGSLYSC